MNAMISCIRVLMSFIVSLTCRRYSAKKLIANSVLDFLYHKRNRRDLPEDVTDAVCGMATRDGQHWQIGSSDTLQHLRQAHCPDESIEQLWVTWTPSELGAPTPFGSPLAQGQLLSFLSNIIQVCPGHHQHADMYASISSNHPPCRGMFSALQT